MTNTMVSDKERLLLSQNDSIGAGNLLGFAIQVSPSPKMPLFELENNFITFWGEEYSRLSLVQLDEISDAYAQWYYQHGVRRYDPVGIYLDDSIEYLIHYFALTKIGAIGVLTNGNMDPAQAAAHFKNVKAIGIFSDTIHLNELYPHLNNSYTFLTTNELIKAKPEKLNPQALHKHQDEDPVMIAHSSGTTGTPKAVLLEHKKFFHGIRYRLSQPKVEGAERILSSLPHSHNCAVAYLSVAMLSGTPVYIASDHTGKNVIDKIEEYKPGMVVSFPQTYVEMAEQNLNERQLSSVSFWFNGGDAAHELHIKQLIRQGSRTKNGKSIKGSIFIDGLGSSEMGFSLFRHIHTPETNKFSRCVGKPLEWVEAKVFNAEGISLGANQVGRLGVKAPSVTSGYWNNHNLTLKSKVEGYFLTGDLAYFDEEGYFYHLDRVPDAIHCSKGTVYSLQTEEFLMSLDDTLADCSVVADPKNDSAVLFVRTKSEEFDLVQKLKLYNESLIKNGLQPIHSIQRATPADIPLGTTGKVLKRHLRTVITTQNTQERSCHIH